MFAIKYLRNINNIHGKFNNLYKIYNYNLKFSHVYQFKRFLSTNVNYPISFDNTKISEAFLNLDANYKQQQRISKSDIESLTKSIENEDINEDHYLLLLQSCGHLIPDELPSARIALAQQAWKILLNKKVNLTIDYYNALLQCYVENKMVISHKEFLSNMKCEPNEQTYDLLLECVCENGDLNQAVEIVNIMKEKGLSANEPVFSSLILCHLRCGDVKSAQNILETMRIAQLSLNSNTYTALLRGYAESNELSHFKNTLNNSMISEFNLKQIISILQSVCISENLELLPLMKKTWATKVDSRTFDSKLINLCTHLIYFKKPLIAYELYKCFVEPEIGFVSESDTYASSLLYEMIKSDTPSEIIIKIIDDLINTNRNTYALYKATEIALRLPNIKISLILLDTMFKKNYELRNHYFWPILLHEARTNGEKGIFEIFKIMIDYNIKIEPETLEVYSLQYITNMDSDVILNRLKQFNLTVTEALSPICAVLLFKGKIQQVSDLTTKYKVKLNGSKLIKSLVTTFINTKDIKSTITILKNIQLKDNSDDWAGQLISLIFTRSGKNINYHLIFELLKEYKKNNIKITAASSDKIEYLCKKIKDKDIKMKILKLLHSIDNISCEETHHIPHPRNMNLEELECHLIELRDKNMEIRGILRKLIQMHCRIGNAKRVTELYAEFEKSGYDVSPGMKSALLDLFIKTENFENAWKIYKYIKDNYKSFIIDEFKIVDLARLLRNNNKFDDAIKLLRNESSERKIIGGSKIEHNCWELLDTVARSGNVKETKSIFSTLTDCGFCSKSNIILGPIVRVHLCTDNASGAVEEYVNCCVKYNKTPLMHELLCYLIKKESSQDLIQKVVEATTLVHGITKSETSLVAALAETGMIKTLRKLFLDLSSPLSPNLLEQYCDKWVTDNKIEALQNIVVSAHGLTNVDLSCVYYNLMRIYSSNNDYDNAIALWNDMQDNNILPSEKMKNLIDSILNTQKQTIDNNF